jgi:RimJ/RimL family protein N-acetyltransferase
MKNRRLISNEQDELLGEVNWYWKSKETNWMEIGVIIFEEQNWGKGIGFQALRKWIDLLFADFPEIVRIGLSTWSGNIGMIKLSQKLGMIEEACYRKARIVNDTYYDSISYGILKEEWENIQWQN